MLERKGIDGALAAITGEPSRTSRAGQQKRKQRFAEIVMATPSVTTERAAAQAGISSSTANIVRKQIVAEHGKRYAAPKTRKYSMAAQAKRLLDSMADKLEANATIGISGIDPNEVDLTDETTVENITVIIKSLETLLRFAKKLERRLQAPKGNTGNNVIHGNFVSKGKAE